MSQLFINNNDNGTIKKMITGGMIITEYTYDDADQNITGQKTYVDESKAVKDERLPLRQQDLRRRIRTVETD